MSIFRKLSSKSKKIVFEIKPQVFAHTHELFKRSMIQARLVEGFRIRECKIQSLEAGCISDLFPFFPCQESPEFITAEN